MFASNEVPSGDQLMKTTAPTKIIGLGGSLRAKSFSSAALRIGLEIAEGMGASTELLDLRQLDIPIYVPDLPIEGYPGSSQETVRKLVASFRSADLMVWATPTYLGAMSGLFKNAVDYMEFLAKDPRPYFKGRAIGLVSLSDSTPLASMSSCVNELRAWLAPTRVTLTANDFSAEMTLTNELRLRRLTRMITELMEFRTWSS